MGFTITFELFLDFIKNLFGYQHFMLSLIPITAFSRKFKDTVVEGIAQCAIDIAESEWFIPSGMKIQLKLEPMIDSPSRPFLMGHFFKHFGDNMASVWVNDHLAFLV